MFPIGFPNTYELVSELLNLDLALYAGRGHRVFDFPLNLGEFFQHSSTRTQKQTTRLGEITPLISSRSTPPCGYLRWSTMFFLIRSPLFSLRLSLFLSLELHTLFLSLSLSQGLITRTIIRLRSSSPNFFCFTFFPLSLPLNNKTVASLLSLLCVVVWKTNLFTMLCTRFSL